jgi:hypothetical protein
VIEYHMAWRWLGFTVGIVVLFGTALSVVGTLVVPRSIDSRISRGCERVVDAVFSSATRRVRTFLHRDRILAWQAPTALLVRLGVWIGLLVIGYGLVLLPLVAGPVSDAFSQAGSSIFTVGSAVPTNASSTVVDYIAAFTGVVVVGLQIGYLPTLYVAFNRREAEVTLLIARAGVPAWGPEILARTRWGIYDGDSRPALDDLFEAWERWAAEVAESHTSYLTLARLRSPHPLSHWLTSALAVMDAAALHLALAPGSEPKYTARLCLRMGFVALNQIAATMRLPVQEDPDPDGPISLSYTQFAAAVEMLRGLNYPIERPAEQAWPDFRGWRANYDTVALSLTRALDAPPALWSGDRRWPSTPIPPQRPTTRRPRDAAPQGAATP